MKYILVPALFAFAVSISGASQAEEKTITLSVPDMNCASCPYMVKQALLTVDGVKGALAEAENRTATVTYEDTKTNLQEITAVTAKFGYPSTLIEEKSGS